MAYLVCGANNSFLHFCAIFFLDSDRNNHKQRKGPFGCSWQECNKFVPNFTWFWNAFHRNLLLSGMPVGKCIRKAL